MQSAEQDIGAWSRSTAAAGLKDPPFKKNGDALGYERPLLAPNRAFRRLSDMRFFFDRSRLSTA